MSSRSRLNLVLCGLMLLPAGCGKKSKPPSAEPEPGLKRVTIQVKNMKKDLKLE